MVDGFPRAIVRDLDSKKYIEVPLDEIIYEDFGGTLE